MVLSLGKGRKEDTLVLSLSLFAPQGLGYRSTGADLRETVLTDTAL